MKKYIAGAAALLLVAGSVAFAGGAASATEPPSVCQPSDAWTETIEHPAEGEPTIIVDNPDYVPAVDEVSHIVHHPAVTEEVHHPAVTETIEHAAEYRTEYHFAKFVRERTKSADVRGFWQEFSPNQPKKFVGPPTHPTDARGTWSAPKYSGGPQQGASGVFQNGGGNGSWFFRAQAVAGSWSDYGAWVKYSPETHTSWETSTDALGSPQFHSSGTRDGVKWERQWQAQYDGQTRQVKTKDAWTETVIVKDAWTETVVVSEAYDEKVIDVEAKPAESEPTIEVENPDYVPAWTETIEHAAVVCAPIPAAVITASCGAASVDLSNEALPDSQTASFVVNVDGTFYGAYAVTASDAQSVALTFPEDSGEHLVEVYQAGVSEWKLIAEATVASDCEPNVPPKPEIPEPTTVTTYTEWAGGEPTCTNTQVTQTRERTDVTTTVDYVYNADTNEWDRVEASSSVTVVETRVVTYDGELCPPPVPGTPTPTPTVDPTPTPEPTVDPTPSPSETPAVIVPSDDDEKRLAVTGGSINPLIPVSAIVLLAVGGALLRRRYAQA